jgi:hypothetical protein
MTIRLVRIFRQLYNLAVMQPTQELIDDIYRERVLRARRTPPAVKFFAGPDLFERACQIMAAGIRNQFPDADEPKVQEVLRQRLEITRRLERNR